MSGNEERLFEAFVGGLDRSHGLAAKRDAAAFVAKLDGIIDGNGVAVQRSRDVYSGKAWSRWAGYSALAAAVVFIAIQGREQGTPAEHNRIYRTTAGERATVTLGDGSRVTLAPATTMSVRGRTVTLTGEALFTITRHTENPFTVRTPHAIARVLGTSFGVRDYPTDSIVRVAVAEGKVAVSALNESSVLTNGDLATVNWRGTLVTNHDAEEVASWLAFAQGRLVLGLQPLSEAAPQIGRWFDLDVRVHPAVADRMMRVTLHTEGASESLDVIARLTETTYTRNGHVVTFVPRR